MRVDGGGGGRGGGGGGASVVTFREKVPLQDNYIALVMYDNLAIR